MKARAQELGTANDAETFRKLRKRLTKIDLVRERERESSPSTLCRLTQRCAQTITCVARV